MNIDRGHIKEKLQIMQELLLEQRFLQVFGLGSFAHLFSLLGSLGSMLVFHQQSKPILALKLKQVFGLELMVFFSHQLGQKSFLLQLALMLVVGILAVVGVAFVLLRRVLLQKQEQSPQLPKPTLRESFS
jgi:hypothetical protein